MKGVTAIYVMLCLTTPRNNYLLIRGLIFHHRFPCSALQFTHCGDIDVEGNGLNLTHNVGLVSIYCIERIAIASLTGHTNTHEQARVYTRTGTCSHKNRHVFTHGWVLMKTNT